MKKMSRLTLSILSVFLILSASHPALAYDDTLVIESLQTVQGDLTGVDTDNKRVTIRWMADNVLMKYQDLTLSVPDTCVITKNSEARELTDLETGDSATVRFDSNAQPLARAVSITVFE